LNLGLVEERAMPEQKSSTGVLGAILGGLVAVALVAFILTGGELGGKKTVHSDADLPPIAAPATSR
jgi:hypothetical protein